MRKISKKIIEVPYISQAGLYPTGCESVSTVMLLRYLGIKITVDGFIEKYLIKQNFEVREGIVYGPDPRKVFCGNPYSEDGMGCYAPVICEAMNRVFAENIGEYDEQEQTNPACESVKSGKTLKGTYTAVDETNKAVEDLLTEYIDRDMPVIFWACIDMREPVTGPDWELLDGSGTFTWISNEHCMLLVGYDEEGYYFNDPYENHGLIRYPRELVEKRHRAQYSMAVGVRKR